MGLRHRGWGLGSRSGLGLLEAAMFLPQLSGPRAQPSVALGPGRDHAALFTNSLYCSALGGAKEAMRGSDPGIGVCPGWGQVYMS